MKTVGDLIDRFGGPASFARIIGKGPSTASEMKRRGRIQVAYWPKIIAAAPTFGIGKLDAEFLMKIHSTVPLGDLRVRTEASGAKAKPSPDLPGAAAAASADG